MDGDVDLAAAAAVVAEPARARMLVALGDGRELPASVLAAEAGVSASTARGHLAKLVAAGFLCAAQNGRRRYFRIAGSEVNDVLEALARVAPQALRHARHLLRPSRRQARHRVDGRPARARRARRRPNHTWGP